MSLVKQGSDDPNRATLWAACVAESLGTFILVLFGTGSVAAAVYTGAQVGLWQVAAVWGFGVTLAIYVTGSVSGAHLNPAVSLAFAIFRNDQFPVNRLFAYWGAQLLGAVIAGMAVLILFNPFIDRYETENDIVRGEIGSQKSAMAFGEYFPNPGMFESTTMFVSPLHAFAVEAFGTAILVMVIFALTERRNAGIPTNGMVPFFIGFTVAAPDQPICTDHPSGMEPGARLRTEDRVIHSRLGRHCYTGSRMGILGLHPWAFGGIANWCTSLQAADRTRVARQGARRRPSCKE